MGNMLREERVCSAKSYLEAEPVVRLDSCSQPGSSLHSLLSLCDSGVEISYPAGRQTGGVFQFLLAENVCHILHGSFYFLLVISSKTWR